MSSAVDSCALEPIHIIAHTQSYGLLLAVSEPDYIVRHISSNVAPALARPLEEIVRHPLADALGERQFERLAASFAAQDLLALNPIAVRFGRPERAMDCIAHRYDGMLLLELEPRTGAFALQPLNVAAHVQGPIARMSRETDIEALANVAAGEFARASGFDRVLIYSFDSEWNGEVIADVGEGLRSYLGHRFPASDIPAQARRLFLINTLRSIVDAASEPVPIVPSLGADGKPLDLTRSLLRSASSIHTQYVRNMGVRATMSVSIIVRGVLWGMVTAHHRTPHRLDSTARSICDLLGQVLASQIAVIGDQVLLQQRLTSRESIESYMASIEQTAKKPGEEAIRSAGLLDLLHAGSLISRVDGFTYRYGTTLDAAQLVPVALALRAIASRGVASSNSLVTLDPSATAYAREASGALYLGLSETSEDYVMLFRPELVRTLVWAGNPHKSTTPDASTGRLNPRTSFDSWSEQVCGRCEPWTELDLENGRLLREQFMQLREAQRRHKAQERVRYLAHHDVLTGLPNRAAIADTLERRLASAREQHGGLAVLFVDLNRFKHFNDSLGHAAGDRILQIVATRMKHALRGEDAVGRFGGDEFIAILPGPKSERHATAAAARLRAEIEKPMQLDGEDTIAISASVGIAYYPADGVTSKELLKYSDKAMYRAKAEARISSTFA